jgi:acyl-CoA synthetase (NDP forming)
MYLEGIHDGRRLLELSRRIAPRKPILMLKGGLTDSGARAVASHTASLGGAAQVWDAFFRQTGVVRTDTLEEMADLAMTFLYIKPPRGLRAALLGIGGGNSVLAADALARVGLSLPALAPETTAEIATFVPAAGSMLRNPLDIGAVFRGDLTLLDRTLELVGHDPNIDIILAAPHLDINRRSSKADADRLVNKLSDYMRRTPHGKPLALTFHSFANDPEEQAFRQRLLVDLPNRGVAVFSDLGRAGRALVRLYGYHRFLAEVASDNSVAD